jgi:upstream activation factor subunit UAF30
MPTNTPKKKTTPSAGGGGKSNALQKPLQPLKELAAVVGSASLPRTEVVSKIWDYIRSHNLQNPENRREILADDKLQKVFGKDKGDHVRDEQAPGPAPGMTALGSCSEISAFTSASAFAAETRSPGSSVPGPRRSPGRTRQ